MKKKDKSRILILKGLTLHLKGMPLKKIDNSINFKVNNKIGKNILISFDNEQFSRLFFNLIKN